MTERTLEQVGRWGTESPRVSRSAPGLNQSTHSRVAYSTSSTFLHGPLGWMTSVLNSPMMVSARALSSESPILPTEGSAPVVASRSDYCQR